MQPRPSPEGVRQAETVDSAELSTISQMNTPAIAQAPDTSAPMDIDQNKHKPETHSCYNCNEKGHISRHCPKPWKQQIRSTKLTKLDLKSLVAEAVVAAMDAREIEEKAKEPKEGF